MIRRHKLIVITAVFFGLVIFVWWSYYTFFVFHIISIDPKGTTLPTTQDIITIEYNHRLNQSQDITKMVSLTGSSIKSVTIKDNTITVILNNLPVDKSSVVLSLKEVLSQSNESHNDVISFTVGHVDYNQLSKTVQERQAKDTDSYESSYPLVDKLPYESSEFSISYDIPSGNDPRLPLFISSKAINFADPLAAADSPSSLAVLRQSRQQAIEWLRDNGYDENKYILVFSEPYAVNEFGGIFVGRYRPNPEGE